MIVKEDLEEFVVSESEDIEDIEEEKEEVVEQEEEPVPPHSSPSSELPGQEVVPRRVRSCVEGRSSGRGRSGGVPTVIDTVLHWGRAGEAEGGQNTHPAARLPEKPLWFLLRQLEAVEAGRLHPPPRPAEELRLRLESLRLVERLSPATNNPLYDVPRIL